MAFNTAHFSRMPQSRKPHTRFKMPHCVAGTGMHGDIIPVYAQLVAPGDIIHEVPIGNFRLSTPIAPLYSSIKLSFNAFYVPLRLLWDNYRRFTGENDTSSGPQTTTYYVPSRALNLVNDPSSHSEVGSVSHYLGKPLYKGIVDSGTTDNNGKNKVSVLKERAYWLIRDEWYRHEQIQNPVLIAKDDTGKIDAGNLIDFTTPCAKCLKDFDYFTTCTISPIYSNTPVTMPLGTTAPLIAMGTTLNDMRKYGDYPILGLGADIPASKMTSLFIDNNNGSNSKSGYFTAQGTYNNTGITSDDRVRSSNLYADLSNAARADIQQLYLAMAANAWYYNSNFGSRYFESLQIHYGVTNPDLVLQRPEHIGEQKIYLAMQQVLSTAGAANDATTKLGQPGANSSTDFKFNLFNKSFGEWGIVMILMNTFHEQYYSGGVDREDTYREMFDFYYPEFAMIGDQSVRVSELFFCSSPNSGYDNDSAFGFQEAWAELRYRKNRLQGLFDPYAKAGTNSTQNSLKGWVLESPWANRPYLNDVFIEENRDAIQDALVTGSSGPDFLYYIYFNETATRELPLYSVPGLPGRGRGII